MRHVRHSALEPAVLRAETEQGLQMLGRLPPPARAELLHGLRFPAGYGVEIANLIDAARVGGIDAVAQVDLGTRQNRHQSLRDLSAMAYAVMVAAAVRLQDGGLAPAAAPLALPPAPGETAMEMRPATVIERPPLSSISPWPRPSPGSHSHRSRACASPPSTRSS